MSEVVPEKRLFRLKEKLGASNYPQTVTLESAGLVECLLDDLSELGQNFENLKRLNEILQTSLHQTDLTLKPLQTENVKLAKENLILQHELAKSIEANKILRNWWDRTEKDLITLKKELEASAQENGNDLKKSGSQYIQAHEQLDLLIKRFCSSPKIIRESPSRSKFTFRSEQVEQESSRESKQMTPSRIFRAEDIVTEESFSLNIEEKSQIWLETLKESENRASRMEEVLKVSESIKGTLEENLKLILSQKEQRIKTLIAQKEELEQENRTLEKRYKEITERKVVETITIKEERTSIIEYQKREIKNLQDRINEIEKEYNNLRKEMSNNEESLSIQNKLDKKTLRDTISKLEDEKAKLEHELTKLDIFIVHKERAQNLLNGKLAEKDSPKSKLSSVKVNARLAEELFNRIKNFINDLEIENFRLIQRNSELKNHYERANKEAQRAKEQRDLDKRRADKIIEGLEKDVERKRESLRQILRDNKEAAMSPTHSAVRNDSLTREQEDPKLKNEIKMLLKKSDELDEELKKAKMQLQEKIDDNDKQIEDLTRLNQGLQEENNNLKKNLTDLSKSIELYGTEINRRQQENQQLYSALRERELELENTKKELMAVYSREDKIQEGGNRGTKLGVMNSFDVEGEGLEILQSYKAVCIQNEKVRAELESNMKAYKECLRELRDSRTETEALKEKLKISENEKAVFLNEINIYKVDIYQLNEKLAWLENELARTQQSLEKMNEYPNIIRSEREQVMVFIQEVQKRFEIMQNENRELVEQINNYKNDVENLRQEVYKRQVNNEVMKDILKNQKSESKSRVQTASDSKLIDFDEAFRNAKIQLNEFKRKAEYLNRVSSFNNSDEERLNLSAERYSTTSSPLSKNSWSQKNLRTLNRGYNNISFINSRKEAQSRWEPIYIRDDRCECGRIHKNL